MKKLLSLLTILAIITNSELHAQPLQQFRNEKEMYGLKDKDGNIVVPARYTFIGRFNEGMAAVNILGNVYERTAWGEPRVRGGKWGYINERGEEIIPLEYEDAWPFFEGLAVAKLKGKFGFIDKSGKEVIPFIYDGVYDYGFQKGKARVSLKDKSLTIDASGKIL